MKFEKIILLFLITFLGMNSGFAQGTIIRGHINDPVLQESVIGVSIAEFDSDNRIIGGTITDVNGNFQIVVKSTDHVLEVSCIGYSTQRFEIGIRNQFDIDMETDNVLMEEVVVTAIRETGSLTNVPLVDLAASVTEVNMVDINEVGASSAADALQGKVGGLDITSGGTPGGGSQIIIRGMSSLSGSQPLIVVDGLAQDVRSSSDIDFGSADAEDIGDLVNVAPQDIKTIRVLKDASATAQWGARGADGVIEITTKRGKKGKTNFNYDFSTSKYFDPSPIPLLDGDEFVTLMIDELKNSRGVFSITEDYPQIANDPNSRYFHNYNKNTDWLAEITRPGNKYEHFFSASGGGERARYNTSVGYETQEGTTKGEASQKISTRINIDYSVTKKLKLSTNFSYSNLHIDGNYRYTEKATDGSTPFRPHIRSNAYRMAPNMSVYEYDSSGVLTGNFFNPLDNFQGDEIAYYNPAALIAHSYTDNERNDLSATAQIKYSISPALSFNQMFAYQYRGELENSFLSRKSVATPWIDEWNDKTTEENFWYLKRLSRSTLNYNKTFANIHTLSTTLLWEVIGKNDFVSKTTVSNGLGASIQESSVEAVINNLGSGEGIDRQVSGLGMINYKLLGKYVFQGGVRMEGSGKFGKNNRWGYFPNFGFTYHMHKEKFMANISWLSNSRIRLSYGVAGKAPKDAFIQYSIYRAPERNTYIGDRIITPIRPELRELVWERSYSTSAGWDLGFFKDRITIIAEIYRIRTYDILTRNYSIPASSGYNSLAWFNGGAIENKGWEFTVQSKIKREGDLKIDANFNINRNINSFIEFADNFEQEKSTSIRNGVYPYRLQLNKPVGSFYGFIYEGVYQTDEEAYARDADGNIMHDLKNEPIKMISNNNEEFGAGDTKYRDINNDARIDLKDVVYLGNMLPEYTGNIGTRLSYKNIGLNVNFLYRMDFQIINQLGLDLERMTHFNNQSRAVLNRWRDESVASENQIHKAEYQHTFNSLGSSYYVEDGDYLRLNSISLTYNMPKAILSDVKLGSMKITLSGRKLLTFTNYSGVDPEIKIKSPEQISVDNARTPVPKYYTVNVHIGF
jgi:TonB-linked SusC/RagA family outer membrane protein